MRSKGWDIPKIRNKTTGELEAGNIIYVLCTVDGKFYRKSTGKEANKYFLIVLFGFFTICDISDRDTSSGISDLSVKYLSFKSLISLKISRRSSFSLIV
jgi:hypothetical protein